MRRSAAAAAVQAGLRGLLLRRRFAAIILLQALSRRHLRTVATRARRRELDATMLNVDVSRAAWSDAAPRNRSEARDAVSHLRRQFATWAAAAAVAEAAAREGAAAAPATSSVAHRLQQARALASSLELPVDAAEEVLPRGNALVPVAVDAWCARVPAHDNAAAAHGSDAPSDGDADAAVASGVVQSLRAGVAAPARRDAAAVDAELKLRVAMHAFPVPRDPAERLREAVSTVLLAAFAVASRKKLTAHLALRAAAGDFALHHLIDDRESAADDLFDASPLYDIGVKARVVQRVWRLRRRGNAVRKLQRLLRSMRWKVAVAACLHAAAAKRVLEAQQQALAQQRAAEVLQRAWRCCAARRKLRLARARRAAELARACNAARLAAAVKVLVRGSAVAALQSRCRAAWSVYRGLQQARAERLAQQSSAHASALHAAVDHARMVAHFDGPSVNIARYRDALILLFGRFATEGSGAQVSLAQMERLCCECGIVPLLVTRRRLARLFKLCAMLRRTELITPLDLGACLAAVATTSMRSPPDAQGRVDTLFRAVGLADDATDLRAFIFAAERRMGPLGGGVTPPPEQRAALLAAALKPSSPPQIMRDVRSAAAPTAALPPIARNAHRPRPKPRRQQPRQQYVEVEKAAVRGSGEMFMVVEEEEEVEEVVATARGLAAKARAALRRFEREAIHAQVNNGTQQRGGPESAADDDEQALESLHPRRSVLESLALGY